MPSAGEGTSRRGSTNYESRDMMYYTLHIMHRVEPLSEEDHPLVLRNSLRQKRDRIGCIRAIVLRPSTTGQWVAWGIAIR